MKTPGIELVASFQQPAGPRRSAPLGDDFDGALREASAERAEPRAERRPARDAPTDPAGDGVPAERERVLERGEAEAGRAADREPPEPAENGPADVDCADESGPAAGTSGDGTSSSAEAAASIAAAGAAAKAHAPAAACASPPPAPEHRGGVGAGVGASSRSGAPTAHAGATNAGGLVAPELASDGARRAAGAEDAHGVPAARLGRSERPQPSLDGRSSGGAAEQPSSSHDEPSASLPAAQLGALRIDLTASSAAGVPVLAGGPAVARGAMSAEATAPAAPVRSAHDGSADGAVLRNAAHLRVAAPGVGELELHLRVREGVAHVRVDGEAARVVEAHVADLSRALAGEGLKLGQLDARIPPATSQSTGWAHGDAPSHQHRRGGRERDETPPGAPPPKPPRAVGTADGASPAAAGRYAVRA